MTALLAVIFGLSMIYVSATSRLEAHIKALALQGVVLFAAVLLDFARLSPASGVFLMVETLAVKALLIPWFLIYIVRHNGIMREDEPYIHNYYSVAAATVIFIAGFAASYALFKGGMHGVIRPVYFGVSVSAMITGLFIIVSRKKLITHVMGYVMMENGIFLLAFSFTGEMPFAVNIGVLMDLFIAVFLLGIFISKISDTFNDQAVNSLSELKD